LRETGEGRNYWFRRFGEEWPAVPLIEVPPPDVLPVCDPIAERSVWSRLVPEPEPAPMLPDPFVVPAVSEFAPPEPIPEPAPEPMPLPVAVPAPPPPVTDPFAADVPPVPFMALPWSAVVPGLSILRLREAPLSEQPVRNSPIPTLKVATVSRLMANLHLLESSQYLSCTELTVIVSTR